MCTYLGLLMLAYNFSKVRKYVFHKYVVFQYTNTLFINTSGQKANMPIFALLPTLFNHRPFVLWMQDRSNFFNSKLFQWPNKMSRLWIFRVFVFESFCFDFQVSKRLLRSSGRPLHILCTTKSSWSKILCTKSDTLSRIKYQLPPNEHGTPKLPAAPLQPVVAPTSRPASHPSLHPQIVAAKRK